MNAHGRGGRRGSRARLTGAAALVSALLWAPVAPAQPDEEPVDADGECHHCPSPAGERQTVAPCPGKRPKRLSWNPDWPRFRTGEYVASGLFLAGALGSLAIPPDEDRWATANEFDTWMRSRLRLGTQIGRDRARDASDVLLAAGINHLVIDSLVVTWWGHGSADVAWELAMMDIEALTFNAMVNGVVAGLTSRERPYRDRCQDPYLAHTDDCTHNKRYRAFYSGHTSTSFTIAGLVCVHHAHLPIYGGGAPDTVACSTSFLFASAVGLLRVVSDQHYTTDVLTGAAIGTLSGLGLPWLLHYRGGALSAGRATESETSEASRPFAVGIVPGPFGGTVWGMF